jgi:hypothetical protein
MIPIGISPVRKRLEKSYATGNLYCWKNSQSISKDSKDVYGPNAKGIQFLKENCPHVLFGANALSNYPDWEERKYGQRGKNKENAFCKYCNGKPSNYNRKYSCFVYQWIEIPNEMSVADLIKAIHDDVLNLMTLSTKN